LCDAAKHRRCTTYKSADAASNASKASEELLPLELPFKLALELSFHLPLKLLFQFPL
jgi:hypothetical protein